MTVVTNLFVSAVEKNGLNMTRTENGALANSTTHNACLDLFVQMGNYRTLDVDRFESMFDAAWQEDRLTALRLLFVNRDVRGGQKVKMFLQHILNQYVQKNLVFKEWLQANLHLIPEYGYWKDLYALHGTDLWPQAVQLWVAQIKDDYDTINSPRSNPISLAAKFAPSDSQNASKNNALYLDDFKKYFGYPLYYRTVITALRKHLNVVETQMSERRWDDINYSHVPSVAFKNYRKAFARHDPEGFAAFIASDKKINAKVLTPLDVCNLYYKDMTFQPDVEKMWKNLDDVFAGLGDVKMLPICDCSGSMGSIEGRAWGGGFNEIQVAAALTIYCAERNRGVFQNIFMEFSGNAKFLKLPNKSLFDKINFLVQHGEVSNTNLMSVFKLILKVAQDNHVPQADMPNSLIIFSDMQFDQACANNSQRNIDVAKKMFADAGYVCPNIVFWNLSSNENVPATKYDDFVTLVSGYSEQMLRYVLCGEPLPTPMDLMLRVVNSERYSAIQI